MRPGRDLIGKPIYSASDGQHLGTVRDLYLDLEITKVTGLFLGHEGLISRKSRLIPGESIALLGMDAILTIDAYAVTDSIASPEVEGWLRRDTFQGRQINTPGGTRVGTVGDVVLDDEGRVLALTLDKIQVEGPVAEMGKVSRSALIETGGHEGIATVDLAKAEQSELDLLEEDDKVMESGRNEDSPADEAPSPEEAAAREEDPGSNEVSTE